MSLGVVVGDEDNVKLVERVEAEVGGNIPCIQLIIHIGGRRECDFIRCIGRSEGNYM